MQELAQELVLPLILARNDIKIAYFKLRIKDSVKNITKCCKKIYVR